MREDLAIIGLAGRFPGARNVDQLWRNVCDGVESIRFFDESELRRAGVPREQRTDPSYVPASPVLEGFDAFDAALFECSPMEARLMDPQHRVLLEVAWETLEDAGYDSTSYCGPIGVFAGSGGSASSYLISDVHINHALRGTTGSLQHIANDKDFLAARVAYKLNLRGPSVTVQAACSTSIVAIHLACLAVLHGECDMALAGGVAIRVPHLTGYRCEGSGIWSRDGHCRPFDADGSGTVFGSGAGLVLIKPLKAALADGDRVHAVIKGVAINNDGSEKLSFAVASGDGIARAAKQALAVGGVAPSTVGLVMAHANGNAMGDVIEFQALSKAFRSDEVGAAALSSVKGNIGHPEQASGLASLAVAVQALRNQTIPPTLHCATPNPRLRLSRSPFFISDRARPWLEERGPRRAGVSSIAIGGTNAFVVLEQAPATTPAAPAANADARVTRLLRVSAQTDAALHRLALRFAEALEPLAPAELADFCFTANVGRRRLRRQIVVVGETPRQFAEALRAFVTGTASPRVITQLAERIADPRAMLVLGDVAPMGHRDALAHSRAFADAIARCEQACRIRFATSLRAVIAGDVPADEDSVRAVATFAASYAYGELLAGIGVEIAGIVGSGVGRHAAACLRDATLLPSAIEAVLAHVTSAGSLDDELRRARARGSEVFIGVGEVDASAVPGESWIRLASDAQTSGAHALIEAVARLAAHGVAIGAGAFEGAAGRRRVAIPGYPFESQRYWIDDVVPRAEPGATPLLRRVRSPALHDVVIEGRLEGSIGAGGHLELVRQAASALVGDRSWSVAGLSFREPLALTGARSRIVQLIARPRGDGWTFDIVSGTEDGEGAWTEHVRGALRVDATAAHAGDGFDLVAIRERCPQLLESPGLPRVMRGEGEAIAELIGAANEEVGGLAVLDACRHVVHAIAPPLGEGEVYQSVSVESGRIHTVVGSEVTCHVVLRGPISDGSAALAVDVSIYAGNHLAIQLGAWRWKRTRIASRPIAVAGRSAIVEELTAAPPAMRRSIMMSFVTDQVRKALGAGPHERIDSSEGFRDRGLDSMTSVQLRESLQELLGVPLSNTLTFNHPNLQALSGYLLTSLFPADEEHRPVGAPKEITVAMGDLETAIESELEILERVLGAN